MKKWNDVRFQLPLNEPPRIKWIAVGAEWPRDNEVHYELPGHWYAHIYSCDAAISINGRWFPIRPGYAGFIPPGCKVSHRFRGRATHLFAHFDFANADRQTVPVPAMQDLGSRYLPLSERFYDAITVFQSNPARATARLWEILWELAQPTGGATTSRSVSHAGVQRVCQLIDQFLAMPLSVPQLADYVDLSPNHLSYLFRRHLGTTVVAYVRHQRAMRAQHLLLHSSLPIKTIAQQVGIPDPHLFNKIMRREIGASPRGIRQRGTV